MITINTIAKEAEVSAGTVDRVLHNRGGVSKKTAARINEIIKKHNFEINKVASALALKKKIKIATLIPEFNDKNTFWKAPLRGFNKAHDEIKKFGADVSNFTFDQFDVSSYLSQFKELLETCPDGVIIAPSFGEETRQIVEELEENKIPFIFINIDLDGFNNMSFIGQDSYMGGYLAGKLMHLCLKDVASVLIIKTRLNIDNNHAISKRINGFLHFFSDNKIDLKSTQIDILDLNNIDLLNGELNSILENDTSINGVYVPNSRIAVFANCIDNLKLKNLSLIGFDGTEENINCLNEDKVSFLISQKVFKQGYNSVKIMSDFLIEKIIPKSKLYSPIQILTKENVKYS